MQIVNNYDKDVYNGDIGRIASIDEDAKEVKVIIDDREVTYDYSDLMNLYMPMRFLSINHRDQNTLQS